LIVTNIYKILDEEIVETHKGKMINLHYSLLPAYAGLIGEEPVIQAMKYSKFVGSTLHYVEKQVDAGRVIIQGVIKNIGEKKDIMNKVFQMGCFTLLYYIYTNYPETRQIELGEIIDQKEYIFSPNLNFNITMFNEKFWTQLRD
jgi:phosphoribosylglycinamide formyltransferase 1